MSTEFDWILRSPTPLPPAEQWRYPTLRAMLQTDDLAQDQQPLLLGANHSGPLEVTLADLRHAAEQAKNWCAAAGFAPGDSLLLVRLPYSSEVPLAVAVIGLMSLGLRVVLPMSVDQVSLVEIAEATSARALLWCAGEATRNLQARAADTMLRGVASKLDLPTFSVDGELDWHQVTESDNSLSNDNSTIQQEREVLVLSTSGSTGRPKLVRYTDRALLRVAEAWNAVGLMSLELTGGRSICPTLSHSMGLRSMLHAVWNRQPILLAQPEWLEDQPKKFVKLLERCAPQHITCGPAILGDLSLLAANLKRVRSALSSLRCIVSSGAAEVAGKNLFPGDSKTANAFGMTEVQQVLNTLVGPDPQVAGSLGYPLPGVAVAVRYLAGQPGLGRLFVNSPFGAKGYVGEPEFGEWLDTGDLVKVVGNELVWIGRIEEDFLSTGRGVKVSLHELQQNYQRLLSEAEAVLFIEAPQQGGVAALVYVGVRDPAAAETHDFYQAAIQADHEAMTAKRSDFALAYQAITVAGCAAGRPPQRGPGKIDRQQVFATQAKLITAMNDPLADHPQSFRIHPLGSERPDWRRFAGGA